MAYQMTVWVLLTIGFVALWPGDATAQVGGETVLTILHTNDPHGRVVSSNSMSASGAGGLARVAGMVRQIRHEMPNVILLEGGDVSQGDPTEYFTRAASAFDVMNAMGYDAATLGNHEFDWGQDVAEANIARAQFPMLGANVRDKATGGVFGGAREYVILERGGVRVAVFGLATMETIPLQWPPTMSRVRLDDPLATAARLVPILRPQADVVIALSHLGYSMDQTLALVPGIDVIIGGHSHTTLSTHAKVGNTLIAQTGSYAKNLGRMDLRLERSGSGWAIRSINGQGNWWANTPNPPLGKVYPKSALLPVPESAPYDATVMAAYRPAWDAGQAALDEALATALEKIPGQDGTTVIRPLPLLLGDMTRLATGADIAMMPGSVGPELPEGTVYFRDIFTLIGGYTRRNLVVVRVTEGYLRRLLSEVYRTEGSYPSYFSGVGGRITRPPGSVAVLDLRVNGVTPAPGATYTLIAPSYLVMGSATLRALPVVTDDIGWMFDRIAEGMRAAGVLTAPAQTLELAPPAPVTLAHDASAGAWTLENGRLRARITAADGRVASLIKRTGAAAGSDQARADFRSFLDRVNRTGPSAPTLTPDPDGTDSDAARSLRVEYEISLGAGRIVHVTKTYRLRRDLSALEADLAFRNDTGADWLPADPQDGAQSIVYVAPGGSAPKGDEVRVKTVQGMDVVTSGTNWWGAAPTGQARPEPAEGWLAAVDRAAGVVNAITWDHHAQKAFSKNGVSVLKTYTGSNRFQVEPLFTRIPAGQTAAWRQTFLVDDGIADVSHAASDALIAGVTVSAKGFTGGSPAQATFRLNSTRPSAATYDLTNVRIEAADGRRALDLPDQTGIAVPASAHVALLQRFPLDVLRGNYVLKADVVEAGASAPLTTLISPPFAVSPPLSRSGDVDGDGQVRLNDAALALRLAGGLATPNDGNLVRGDVYPNTPGFTLEDALAIVRSIQP